MRLKLIVNPGQEAQWEIPLEPGAVVLGSDPALPWAINHPSVSNQHCEIQVGADSVLVRDLGSEFGTQIGGQPVTESNLLVGERLRAGDIELELAEDKSAIIPQPPEPPLARKIPKAANQFSFWSSFIYPFKGEGVIILGLGALAFYATSFSCILGAAFAGYMFLYGKEIVATTADGEKKLPNWPIIDDWTEKILKPALQYFALALILFWPVIMLQWYYNPWESSLGDLAILIAAVLGIFFVPSGIVALTYYDTFGALNPVGWVSLILKMPKNYFLTALAFEAILATSLLVSGIAGSFLTIPFVGGFVTHLLDFYFFTVAMRNAGLLVRKME